MKKFIALMLLFCTVFASGQQVSETGNIVYTNINPPPPGTPISWNGFINYNTGGGGLEGGNIPAYNSNTGTFVFGYQQGTINYSTAINYALANAGIQVTGFRYSWQYFNQDYSRGTLTGNIGFTNNTGQTFANYFFNMPQTTEGWTMFSGVKSFNTPYGTPNLGSLNVSFTGKDDRFWAGYWGPQIRNIDVRLQYTPIPTDFSRWLKVANENDTFTLKEPSVVRYGAQDSYIYQTYQPGTYACSNEAWKQDPIGGVYKSCSAGTNTSPPLPTPTTTDITATTTNSIIAAASEPILLAPVTTTTTSTNTGSDSGSTTTTSTNSPTSSSTPTTSTVSTTTTASTTAVQSTPTTTTATTSSPNSNSRATDGTSIGLSVVARNQQREQTIAMQASQAAIQIAQEVASQTQQEALSVASQSSANSMAMATPSVRSSTMATEVKAATNNTDLTFQNNQSTSSMSLFASPTTVTNTQKQTDNQQVSVAAIATTVQSTRTTQSTQPVDTTTSVDKGNISMSNNIVSTVEIEKPPIFNSQVRNVSTTTVSSTPTDTSIQQVQPTYSLLPPVVAIATQSVIPQSYKLVPDREIVVNEREKLQEIAVNSTVNNITLLPPRQEMPQTSVLPVVATVFQNTTITTSSQPVIQLTNDITISDSQKMLLDRSNPLFQTLENKNIETPSNLVAQQGPAVNRNAQNNEAAGNVDINRMATAPAGYADYLSLTLRDAAFYAPKEVYKNQRVVDNVRILRSLASDRLHQEMVNQQYERK